MAETIVRHVKVDHTLTPQQVIEATGFYQCFIDPQVLAEMPAAGFEEGEVVVFELDYDPTRTQLDHEYELRDLRPSPLGLASLICGDRAFADKRPVVSQWRDKQGRACYLIFMCLDGLRLVLILSSDKWSGPCRLAGVRV